MMQSFFHTMDTLDKGSSLAVAVSGGADSMALLLLAHEWAQKQNSKLVALTVDHGLRQESEAEAQQVAAWCNARGIEHHILTWRPESKPTQAESRDKRYALLTDWCKEHSVFYLLTAHHRGDQAETLFFRLARGSSLRGLSCIAPVSKTNDIYLVRPLLGISKKELKEFLISHNQEWIEDPSNQNPAYTRNAIRAEIQSLSNADDIEIRAAKLAEQFRVIREKLDQKAMDALTNTVQFGDRETHIDAKGFAALPSETALLVASQLICELTGDDHPPRTEKLKRLCQWLSNPTSGRASLAHLEFTYHPTQSLFTVHSAH